MDQAMTGPPVAPSGEHAAAKEARSANQVCYHTGAEVRGYLAEPYHRLRREIAVQLLTDAFTEPRWPAPPGMVLELGCGPESLLGRVPGLARPLVVADIAFNALRVASGERAVPAVCLDATRPLPFQDQSLAALVMAELIEHVYDPRRLLHECHRVLRPGGVLVLTTPNLATLQDRLRFLAGRTPRHVNPLHPYLWLHIRPFTASLLAQVLRDAGFQPAVLKSNYVVWLSSSGWWLKWRALAKIAPSLGGSLIVAARRQL
jgi:SAM-dependent methyltransferase